MPVLASNHCTTLPVPSSLKPLTALATSCLHGLLISLTRLWVTRGQEWYCSICCIYPALPTQVLAHILVKYWGRTEMVGKEFYILCPSCEVGPVEPKLWMTWLRAFGHTGLFTGVCWGLDSPAVCINYSRSACPPHMCLLLVFRVPAANGQVTRVTPIPTVGKLLKWVCSTCFQEPINQFCMETWPSSWEGDLLRAWAHAVRSRASSFSCFLSYPLLIFSSAIFVPKTKHRVLKYIDNHDLLFLSVSILFLMLVLSILKLWEVFDRRLLRWVSNGEGSFGR